jgi:tRNA pseudouridine55 synthase
MEYGLVVTSADLDRLGELDYPEGCALLIDKPLDWTSFNVVGKIRNRLCRHLNRKKFKVGHAGTLDPRATGLLIICTGKMTKQITSFMGLEKEYTGTITFGGTRPSYDMETAVDQVYPFDHIDEIKLEEALKHFRGEFMQQPPIFSAKQVDGKRAYESARKGREVKLHPCPVEVTEFTCTRLELPEMDFRVRCSKGTYIRSLAHDLGKALGSGGYLSCLRRTAIGDYRVEDAIDVEVFADALTPKIDI